MVMKIGILQAGRSPDQLQEKYGDYNNFFERFLGGRGIEFVNYPVLDGVFPDSVHDADGWLITGSRFGVYEGHDWIPPLEDFIRECHEKGVPMVGICFGHQAIAQALGGKVEKYSGGWSVGRERYDMDGFDDDVYLHAWHQDQVLEKPAEAEVAGSSPFCRYAALVYGDWAWTVQPHPEFNSDFVADLIVARGNVLPAEIAHSGNESLGAETSSPAVAEHIEKFFKKALQKG
jgi:GMP synthase (glutamine-hydrolysing)